jgi:hypothetical protein
MSRMKEIEDLFEQYGPCTVYDLEAHLIDCRIDQAVRCAHSLLHLRRLERLGTVQRPSGQNAVVYAYKARPGDDSPPIRGTKFWQRQVPSVFHLGEAARDA